MRTTKPISTISYNTPAFLRLKLDELRKAKKITFWAYILHKPEKDEGKAHAHVYIEPAKMIQTADLEDFFLEPDLQHPEKKPLKVLDFHGSKFDDWYLYGLHDTSYLASKGLAREYHYTPEEIVSSDADSLHDRVQRIDMIHLTPYKAIADAILQGTTWLQFLSSGRVPIQQIRNYEAAWKALNATLKRSAPTHTPISEELENGSENGSEFLKVDGDNFYLYDGETGEVLA